MLEELNFDLAFSFAGEDREIVEEIYNKLTKKGVLVFYDNAYQAQLVGVDLYKGLRNLYKNKGKYIVCFVSENYAKKVWTTLEFTAIKERLMASFFASDFLIPIIIGNVKMLEDIPSFIGFYNHHSVDDTVKMLIEKLNSTTNEDNLIMNVNNCIEYICPQIEEYLSIHNIDIESKDKGRISIINKSRINTYYFTGDTLGQTPCILITRNDKKLNPKVLSIGIFPSYIITWVKHDNLSFSIHEFDGNSGIHLDKLSLSDMVRNIAYLIESEIKR